MGSLGFCSPDCGQVIWFCCCLFDVIVELHDVDENLFNDFLIKELAWILHVIKAYLIHDLQVVYVVEAFITLN